MNIREALYAGDGRVIRGPTPWITGRLCVVEITRVVIVGSTHHTYQLDAMLIDRDDETLNVTVPFAVCNPQRGGVDVVEAFCEKWTGRRVRIKGHTMRIETASILQQKTGKTMPLRVFVERIDSAWK